MKVRAEVGIFGTHYYCPLSCMDLLRDRTHNRKMRYRIADLVNGPFGDTYSTYEEAMIARQECVEDGFKANLEGMDDEEAAMEAAQDFFRIVDAATGEEVAA